MTEVKTADIGELVRETEYVLIKRDLFECPKHQGYTGIRDKAGTWPLEDFSNRELPIKDSYTRSHEHYALPLSAAPEFTNACFDDLARDHLIEQRNALEARCAEAERQRDEAIANTEHALHQMSALRDRIEREPVVRALDDDQIMEIIREVAPWKDEPKLNDLLTYEKSPPLFPQATYDVPSYRAERFVRAVERRILSALETKTPEEDPRALGSSENPVQPQRALARADRHEDHTFKDVAHQSPERVEAEPVAWHAFCDRSGGQMVHAIKGRLIEDADTLYGKNQWTLAALYASPPAPVVTDEMVAIAVDKLNLPRMFTPEVRNALEAALASREAT